MDRIKNILKYVDIEKYGTGFIRIREELIDYPSVKVEIKQVGGIIITTIYESKENNGAEKAVEKDIEKVVEKDVEKLSNTQKSILSIIEMSPHITIQVLSKETGINARNIQKHLKQLKDKKFIERIGPDRGGYWKVLKKTINNK